MNEEEAIKEIMKAVEEHRERINQFGDIILEIEKQIKALKELEIETQKMSLKNMHRIFAVLGKLKEKGLLTDEEWEDVEKSIEINTWDYP